VNKAHELGFKVIIDWVANHTGWDNNWITEHKDWYTQDSLGNVIPPNPDWSDIADLNFDSKPMRRAMIDAMDYWVKETNIDGFRCDVAWGISQDFWEAATASLDSIKPVYMLAEDEDHPALLEKAFESNYTWKLHHILNEVAQGKKSAADIQKYYTDSVSKYAPGTFPMQFITNHDENSWAGSEYERMGEAVKTFANALLRLDVPLIPRIITEIAHSETGIDIHPGATIGDYFTIDHGTGVVIGETAVIGSNVKMYQGVTLGAKSFPLDENGNPIKGIPRHPRIGNDVVIYSNSTILGTITVGDGAVIGGNIWVDSDVAPGAKIVQRK
jgi:serine acetyltransferase